MSQVLTLELSEEAYRALQQQAEIAGISVSEWIATSLEQQSPEINFALFTRIVETRRQSPAEGDPPAALARHGASLHCFSEMSNTQLSSLDVECSSSKVKRSPFQGDN